MIKIKTLIIIPAYNEGQTICELVNNIRKINKEVDIVIINDCSKDNTLIEARKADAKVIDLSFNLGIGGAVQTGYIYAYENNYDIAIQIDGDGQHDPKYIEDMIKYIENKEYDMVIGSRFIEHTSYKQTFFRMLGINITSLNIKFYTGKKIFDTTSGYRAVGKKIIEIFANSYPCDYPETETTMRLILMKKKIIEIPVEMRQRKAGKSSIDVFHSIYYMIKVTIALFISRIRKVEVYKK